MVAYLAACLNANKRRLSTLTTELALVFCGGLGRTKREMDRSGGCRKEIRISQRMIRLISFRDETRGTGLSVARSDNSLA